MTKIFCLINRIIVFGMLGTFLIGCANRSPVSTPTLDQIDKSPFTGIPCAAPCWHGLVIGQSNENDVIATLPTLTFINQNTVNIHQMQSLPNLDPSIWNKGVEVTAKCINIDKKKCLTIRVVENKLTDIVTEMNYDISLDQAVIYLGNPDFIGFDRAVGEQMACRVYLVWKEKQLVLASKIFEELDAMEKNCYVVRDTGKISSSLLISEARYLSIKAIEVLLSNSASKFFRFSGVTSEK
jgi:hypothetical protein